MTPLLSAFQNYLKLQGYQPTTIKNYLADTRKYTKFVSQGQKPDHIFAKTNLSAYIHQLNGQNNSPRYLASLNKFCQFAADQRLINSPKLLRNIIKNNQKPTPPTPLFSQFKTHLETKHRSPATIKNYLADLNQYITWSQNQT